MVEVWLPYGDTEVCLTVPPENLLDIVNPKQEPQPINLEEELKKALENPLNTSKLAETMKPEQKIAIAFNKSVNMDFISLVLAKLADEVKKADVPLSNIRVIVGCREGKPITPNEAENLLSKIPEGFEKKIHNPKVEEELVEVGVTSYKTRVFLNKSFFEADLKILVGEVNLNPLTGFGGIDAVLSVCGLKTIHHSYGLSLNPKSRIGFLEENPTHKNLVEIAGLAGVNHILNLVVGLDGKVLRVFFGSLEKTFKEAVNSFKTIFGVEVEDKAEIVVVSPGGNPFDQTFYDAQESLERACLVVKDGGIIVLVAECSQGLGNRDFQKLVNTVKSVEELKTIAKKEFNPTLYKIFRLMNILKDFRVVLVSTLPNTISEVLGFKTSKTVNNAVEYALRVLGKKSKILVLPYAMKIFPILKTKEPQH
ncbi:MAG: nickel-dependent lactate racemase [Candidatus Hecatellales archaeon]|nr:MAG: nickel-dependent lactate racemase [Candidatus Hecatellales archaeon]